MIKRIKNMLQIFFIVTTMVVFITAVYIQVFWGNIEVEYRILWQILGTSFATSLGILVYPTKELSKGNFLAANLLYYTYVNIVVLTAGVIFEWFYFDKIIMVAGMLTAIAFVYILVLGIIYLRDKSLADKLNEKLNERNKEE